MKLTFLGTGTSHGIPVIGCSCPVCTSSDERNKRWRSAVLIRTDQTALVIDTPQEFRLQAIRAQLKHLDAVLYTHGHADHLLGIDDLRVFSRHEPLDVYADYSTLQEIRHRFDYIFQKHQYGGGIAQLALQGNGGVQEADSDISGKLKSGTPFQIGELSIQRIPIYHGKKMISGYRIGSLAYLTDCSGIPDSSIELLRNLDTAVIGALRYHPHPTHFSVNAAVKMLEQLKPRRGLLTHMCHDVEHEELRKHLPSWIEPAYDGLVLDIPSHIG